MAYTPINWQTGDTITAEKLNRCDNGWSVVSSVSNIFTETVTTEDDGMGYFAMFDYADSTITADPAIITFDGVQYTVSPTYNDPSYFYGTAGGSGPDFTTYPFLIISDDTPSTVIYTETAGQHTVSIGVESTAIEVSNNFKSAVATTSLVINDTSGRLDKTWQEIYDAVKMGLNVVIYISAYDELFSIREIDHFHVYAGTNTTYSANGETDYPQTN